MQLNRFILKAAKFTILSLLALVLFFPEIYSQFTLLNVGGNVYVSDIYIFIIHLLAFLIVLRLVYTEKELRVDYVGSLLLLFYSVLIISIISSFPIYGVSAYGMGRNFGLYVPITLLGYYISKHESIESILQALKVFAYVCIVVSVFQYVFNILSQHPEPHRAFGTLKTLVITFFLIDRIYNAITNKVSRSQYALIFLLFMLIILSSQRAIWISLIVIFLIVMVSGRKISFKHLLYSLFTIGIFIIGVINLPHDNIVKKNIVNRFTGIVNPTEDISSSTRLLVWTVSFNDFLNNPIIGEGMGKREKINFGAIGLEGEFEYVMPHNFYLSVAEQRGLIGLIPFIWVGAILFFRFVNEIRMKGIRKNNFELLFLSFLMIIFCYRFFWNGQPILWIVLGIYLSLYENINSNTYVQLRKIYT